MLLGSIVTRRGDCNLLSKDEIMALSLMDHKETMTLVLLPSHKVLCGIGVVLGCLVVPSQLYMHKQFIVQLGCLVQLSGVRNTYSHFSSFLTVVSDTDSDSEPEKKKLVFRGLILRHQLVMLLKSKVFFREGDGVSLHGNCTW